MLRSTSLEAEFRLSPHLLGVSLRYRGEQLLRGLDALDEATTFGLPCGIPLLHPWANRLEQFAYHAAGHHVALDVHSPMLRSDKQGLPLHGVPWSLLRTAVEDSDSNAFTVRIDWNDELLLAIFPFVHTLRITASVQDSTLTICTTMSATGSVPVPVSFGFHPYFGLQGLPRQSWQLVMPERWQLQLDRLGIPRGASDHRQASVATLGHDAFDEAFALLGGVAEFSIADQSRRIAVQCVDGYTHVHVYAPLDQDVICIEPMTAPVNALCSGEGLRTVAPGAQFSATFHIHVQDLSGPANEMRDEVAQRIALAGDWA